MSWANAAFFGMDALGSAINARSSAKNLVSQAQFNTAELLRQLEFERNQRQQAMAFEGQSIQEQLATERRNLEREIQVAEANRQAQLGALLANVGAQRTSMDKQEQLIGDERSRQQQYASGQRDALDANVGMFNDFGGQMGGTADGISQAIMDFIAANQSGVQGPATNSDAVANREAALRQQAGAEVSTDVRNGANVNALGELLANIGVGMGRNNQISDLLGNFAQGSASTLDPALAAAKMWFEQKPIMQTAVNEQYIKPGEFVAQRYFQNAAPVGKTNLLGDLLKMGGQMGMGGAFDGMFKPSPYSLMQPGESFNRTGLQMPTAPNLDYMGGGQGVRLGGGNTGLVLKSNLGIR